MIDEALGFVETRGLVAAIEACDAMLKAARVRLLQRQVTSPALVTICVVGETAAVKAAVDAGALAAARVGRVAAVLVIPRPAAGIEALVRHLGEESWGVARLTAALSPAGLQPGAMGSRTERSLSLPLPDSGMPTDLAGLAALPVRRLRALARRLPGFALSGRMISQATRAKLLELMEPLLFPQSSR